MPSRRAPSPPAPPGDGRRAAVIGYGDGPAIGDQQALDDALARLHALDPAVVAHLLSVGGPPPLRLRPAGFAGLAAIVTGQQLSTASAAAIFGRLEARVSPLDAATLLATPEPVLKALGLSTGKIRTLRAVADGVRNGRLDFTTIATVPAEAAHAALVAMPGIGPWTADAFLLFCLGHPDAWPAGDLALQEAARVALGLTVRPGSAELQRIGDRWRPLRGVAARLLWAYYRVIKGRGGMVLAASDRDFSP